MFNIVSYTNAVEIFTYYPIDQCFANDFVNFFHFFSFKYIPVLCTLQWAWMLFYVFEILHLFICIRYFSIFRSCCPVFFLVSDVGLQITVIVSTYSSAFGEADHVGDWTVGICKFSETLMFRSKLSERITDFSLLNKKIFICKWDICACLVEQRNLKFGFRSGSAPNLFLYLSISSMYLGNIFSQKYVLQNGKKTFDYFCSDSKSSFKRIFKG